MGHVKNRKCEQVQGCGKDHYAKGYCKKHYTQVQRHGRLTPELERGVFRECDAPGCARRVGPRRTYCSKHRRQVATHGRLTPEREHQLGNVGCQVPGCKGRHRAKGRCTKHYNAMRWQRIKAILQAHLSQRLEAQG